MDHAAKPWSTEVPNGWEMHVVQMKWDRGGEEKTGMMNFARKLKQEFTFFSPFLAIWTWKHTVWLGIIKVYRLP